MTGGGGRRWEGDRESKVSRAGSLRAGESEWDSLGDVCETEERDANA